MIKEPLIFRQATVRDAWQIAKVGLASAKVEVREVPLDISVEQFAQIWAERIQDGSHLTYVAVFKQGLFQRDVVCGYVSIEAPMQSGHVMTLYISPDYMRQGIGMFLMQHIEPLVKAAGGRALITDVQPRNVMAHNFYQKFGFVFTDEHREELIVMRKELL
ncbi:MAG: GNAT family N-acetyltransferase [Succinivibrio sp.]|nr:GNAT family N-acetyltransferase [Succinivibrio sp.]